MHGIRPTLSLRSLIPRPRRTASTQTTAPLSVPLETFADSPAQMDSRLPQQTTRLRVHATRLRSSVTVSAWLRGYAPRVLRLARRGIGLAATLAQRWDLRGQPAAFLVVVLVRGSASTLLMILKAVSACRPCASPPHPATTKLTDLLFPPKRWWLHVPSYGLLSHWQGLLDASWCRRCLLSLRRVRRPPLPTRIRSRARWHELHPQAPRFAISTCRSGGRACEGLWIRARSPRMVLSFAFPITLSCPL